MALAKNLVSAVLEVSFAASSEVDWLNRWIRLRRVCTMFLIFWWSILTTVVSPDEKLKEVFSLPEGVPTYAFFYDNQVVLEDSRLGF